MISPPGPSIRRSTMEATGTRRPYVAASRCQERRNLLTCSLLMGWPASGDTKLKNSPASRSSRLVRSLVGMPGPVIGAIFILTAFDFKDLFIESPVARPAIYQPLNSGLPLPEGEPSSIPTTYQS